MITSKIIEKHGIPIRLDRYLRILNPNLAQGIIEQYLRKGLIKVNQKKAKSNLRIQNGDIVTIPDFVMATSESTCESINFGAKKKYLARNDSAELLANKLLTEYLLYDHSAFYAFYKAGGLASQGGSKIGTSLDDALKYLGLRLVHRLDKDTSGIILAAKTRDAAITLTSAFSNNKIYKTYLACVKNHPKKSKGTITSYLLKQNNFTCVSYKTMVEGAKIATTEYEVLAYSALANLIKFTPLTGRMHQIRLHSKDLGCPIIGDVKYGGVANKNLMLHAYKVVLDSSIFGEEIVITAHVPEYFLVKENI